MGFVFHIWSFQRSIFEKIDEYSKEEKLAKVKMFNGTYNAGTYFIFKVNTLYISKVIRNMQKRVLFYIKR